MKMKTLLKELKKKQIVTHVSKISLISFFFLLFLFLRFLFFPSFRFASPLFYQHLDTGISIKGDSAWSPESSSYNQHLTVKLGDRYEIRSIATRGRAHTNEYVTEYIVQYSNDGQAWTSYESQDGIDEVLRKNFGAKKKTKKQFN